MSCPRRYRKVKVTYYLWVPLIFALHVDDCFKFKQCHTLERYNQQIFAIKYHLKRRFVNKLLVDDTYETIKKYLKYLMWFDKAREKKRESFTTVFFHCSTNRLYWIFGFLCRRVSSYLKVFTEGTDKICSWYYFQRWSTHLPDRNTYTCTYVCCVVCMVVPSELGGEGRIK